MAQKKGSTKKTTTKKSAKTQNKAIENERLREQIKTLKHEQKRENTLTYQLMPAVLVFAAIFLVICYIIPEKMGFLQIITYMFYGLFSHGAWLIPVCLCAMAFSWRQDYVAYRTGAKTFLSLGFIISFSSLCQIFTNTITSSGTFDFNPVNLYHSGVDKLGGGFFGGLIGNALEKFTGFGAWIILIFSVILLGFAVFGISPVDIAVYLKNKIRESVYNYNLARQEKLRASIEMQKKQMSEKVRKANHESYDEEANEAKEMRRRRAFLEGIGDDEGNDALPKETPDSDTIVPELSPDDTVVPTNSEDVPFDETNPVNLDAFDEIKNENQTVPDVQDDNDSENSIDLAKIFTDDASIAIAGATAGASAISGETSGAVQIEANVSDDEKEPVSVKPQPTIEEVYAFPPINFLQKDPNPLTFAVTDELKQTSVKLVETLKNFGVKTKIMNICCGPTVTRYELQPEIGVRVRAIANLADDIALHLAAAGVRIEAPIPGKDAVGIEIPNKSVSTVYLRNLIENQTFTSQKSKLTVCLGMDVAGTPVYMNVAKMPHMLIAGATGMGKSVCINSFIVSLLYKARPDEVKLILIDPKKVELSIYNGLPHLLVPVVSDPKKAAGSLAWAVNEMERRFLLIEEVGVRDVDTYNEVTKDDPEKEYLPKIVIIIDELADLMMTARDEVENSICRIAQKARAAGMHLVIGTQRPSVDVITGLIKANVPSRIAFTVASQVDSRTIIDISGAEKLLGRGDMLYAPVGSMKPMRVQGSFVSEKEIENIVEFLKNGRVYEYDKNIIDSIEREAARCGEKKKGKGGGDGDFADGEDKASILSSDEALFPAMEIAVESGSVSTSLLQRKLSLGYSRAARIVDKLEKLGVVGPFEGSKPRKVLITREEYLEMRMNYENGDFE